MVDRRSAVIFVVIILMGGCTTMMRGQAVRSEVERKIEEDTAGYRLATGLEQAGSGGLRYAAIDVADANLAFREARFEYACPRLRLVDTTVYKRTVRTAQWPVYADWLVGGAIVVGGAALIGSAVDKPHYKTPSGTYSPRTAAYGNATWLLLGGGGVLALGIGGSYRSMDGGWDSGSTSRTEEQDAIRQCQLSADEAAYMLDIGVDVPLTAHGDDLLFKLRDLSQVERFEDQAIIAVEFDGRQKDYPLGAWPEVVRLYVENEGARHVAAGDTEAIRALGVRVRDLSDQVVELPAMYYGLIEKSSLAMRVAVVKGMPAVPRAKRTLTTIEEYAATTTTAENWGLWLEGWRAIGNYRPATQTTDVFLGWVRANPNPELLLRAMRLYRSDENAYRQLTQVVESTLQQALVRSEKMGLPTVLRTDLEALADLIDAREAVSTWLQAHPHAEAFGNILAMGAAATAYQWYDFAGLRADGVFHNEAVAHVSKRVTEGSAPALWLALVSVARSDKDKARAKKWLAANDPDVISSGDQTRGFVHYQQQDGSSLDQAVQAWIELNTIVTVAGHVARELSSDHPLTDNYRKHAAFLESYESLEGPGTSSVATRDGGEQDFVRMAWLAKVATLGDKKGTAFRPGLFDLPQWYAFSKKPCDSGNEFVSHSCKQNRRQLTRAASKALAKANFFEAVDAVVTYDFKRGRFQATTASGDSYTCHQDRNCLGGGGTESSPYLYAAPAPLRIYRDQADTKVLRSFLYALDINVPSSLSAGLLIEGRIPKGKPVSFRSDKVEAEKAKEKNLTGDSRRATLYYQMKRCATFPIAMHVRVGQHKQSYDPKQHFYCEVNPNRLAVDGLLLRR